MAPQSSAVVWIQRRILSHQSLILLLQAKLKVQLKLAISRLRMIQQKDTAIAKQQRRAMAQLLEVIASPLSSLILILQISDYPPLSDRHARPWTTILTSNSRFAAEQNRISAYPNRKHHSLRPDHRTPRNPRTLLRTSPRPHWPPRPLLSLLPATFRRLRPSLISQGCPSVL